MQLLFFKESEDIAPPMPAESLDIAPHIPSESLDIAPALSLAVPSSLSPNDELDSIFEAPSASVDVRGESDSEDEVVVIPKSHKRKTMMVASDEDE